MTPFEIASLVISAANAVAAITAAVGIWYGIRDMIRSNEDRAEQQREALKERREADERRHAESMAALKALIASLERQGAVPEELVRRTAPQPGPAG